MKKAQWWSFSTVVNWFSGERFIVSMHEIELAENVRVVCGYTRNLHNYQAKFKLRAKFEMSLQFALINLAQTRHDQLASQRRV